MEFLVIKDAIDHNCAFPVIKWQSACSEKGVLRHILPEHWYTTEPPLLIYNMMYSAVLQLVIIMKLQ